MIYVGDQFKVSRSLYAVDLTSFRLSHGGRRGYIQAVWFRRRGGWKNPGGLIVASAGGYEDTPLDGVHAFLAAHTDNSWGGRCLGRWDGTTYWGQSPQTPEDADRYRSLLRGMLAAYPAIPEGYDGWWGF